MRSVIVLCGLVLSTPVFATDFTQPITDVGGRVVREKTLQGGEYDPTSSVLTVGTVIAAALLAPPEQQRDGRGGIDAIRLANRAKLAIKVKEAKDLDLTAEQIVEIKSSLSSFPPLTVLRVFEAIDPAALK